MRVPCSCEECEEIRRELPGLPPAELPNALDFLEDHMEEEDE